MLAGSNHQGGPMGILKDLAGQETGKIDSRILLKLLTFVKPYRLYLVLAGLFMLVSAATALLVPYLMKVIIDNHLVAKSLQPFMVTSIVLFAIMLVNYGAGLGQNLILSRVGQKVLENLRLRLFEHIQRLSIAYHHRHIIGVTVSRVVNDVEVINNLLSQGLVNVIGDSALIIGTITIMLVMDYRLALLTFIVIPLMLLATAWFTKKARPAFLETREKISRVVGELAESISSMRVIQAFAQEKSTHDQFKGKNRANRDAYIRAVSLSFIYLPFIDFLSVTATCIVLAMGGVLIAQNSLTFGIIVAFMSYVNRFFTPIRDLSQIYTNLQSATAGGERVLQLLETKPLIEDSAGACALSLSHLQGEIRFEAVSFGYLPEKLVLKNINLNCQPGKTTAIVGPTGAGKSSIINLICRFYDVAAGLVTLDGQDIRRVTLASLHAYMGFVPQDPFLFSATIRDNIAFGKPTATDKEIEQAAVLANAHEFIRNLPEGYNTLIYEGAANLSVGQRQLLCIARAILVDPRILIMDEATSSVDTYTEALIQDALKHLLTNRTAVVIAHRLSTVVKADYIYVIDQGEIVEEGRHAALVTRNGLYADLYRKQFID